MNFALALLWLISGMLAAWQHNVVTTIIAVGLIISYVFSGVANLIVEVRKDTRRERGIERAA